MAREFSATKGKSSFHEVDGSCFFFLLLRDAYSLLLLFRMLKRVFSINIYAPVFFSDIILADMLTSFSNVFGDLFIASCVMFAGHDASYFMDNTHNLYYRDYMIPFLIRQVTRYMCTLAMATNDSNVQSSLSDPIKTMRSRIY